MSAPRRADDHGNRHSSHVHGGNGHGGNGYSANGHGANGNSANGYDGSGNGSSSDRVRGAEQQPAPTEFRAVLGTFATGVTIITALSTATLNSTAPASAALDGLEPVGFTCQAFTSLSLDPPLVSFAVSRQSSSRPRIIAAGRFCVNVLAFDQRGLCARFATPGIDRFADVDWSPSPGGSPVLDGSLAWIDCTVEAQYPGGDHTIVIGHVRGLSQLRDAAPLVYHRGEFANCFPVAGSGALPRVS